jgi:hypothetical protein
MTAAQSELWAGKQGGIVGERERPSGPAHSKARPTKCAKLRRLLADGRWHSMRELQDVAGWRYGGRLFDCKIGRDGGEPMDHETKRDEAGCVWYRRKGATQ